MLGPVWLFRNLTENQWFFDKGTICSIKNELEPELNGYGLVQFQNQTFEIKK